MRGGRGPEENGAAEEPPKIIPKIDPRRLRDGPKTAQDASKTAQDSFRRPKPCPRGIQDAPRGLQDGPSRRFWRILEDFGSQNGAMLTPKSHQRQLLVRKCEKPSGTGNPISFSIRSLSLDPKKPSKINQKSFQN